MTHPVGITAYVSIRQHTSAYVAFDRRGRREVSTLLRQTTHPVALLVLRLEGIQRLIGRGRIYHGYGYGVKRHTYALVHQNADACWRMLAYADVCYWKGVIYHCYGHVWKCIPALLYLGIPAATPSSLKSQILTYAGVCWRMLMYADVGASYTTVMDMLWKCIPG
jgi:hypothetical protein